MTDKPGVYLIDMDADKLDSLLFAAGAIGAEMNADGSYPIVSQEKFTEVLESLESQGSLITVKDVEHGHAPGCEACPDLADCWIVTMKDLERGDRTGDVRSACGRRWYVAEDVIA